MDFINHVVQQTVCEIIARNRCVNDDFVHLNDYLNDIKLTDKLSAWFDDEETKIKCIVWIFGTFEKIGWYNKNNNMLTHINEIGETNEINIDLITTVADVCNLVHYSDLKFDKFISIAKSIVTSIIILDDGVYNNNVADWSFQLDTSLEDVYECDENLDFTLFSFDRIFNQVFRFDYGEDLLYEDDLELINFYKNKVTFRKELKIKTSFLIDSAHVGKMKSDYKKDTFVKIDPNCSPQFVYYNITLGDVNTMIDNLINHCIFEYKGRDFTNSELLSDMFSDEYDYRCKLEKFIENTFSIKIDLLNWCTEKTETYDDLTLFKTINIDGYKNLVKQLYSKTKSRVN